MKIQIIFQKYLKKNDDQQDQQKQEEKENKLRK